MLEQLVGESKALDRAFAGEELSYNDGLELMNFDNLHLLGAVADNARKKLVGDTVTFAASYYMNYTNVCAASCQMCAFYRKDGAEDAYTLTPQEIDHPARNARAVQFPCQGSLALLVGVFPDHVATNFQQVV